MTMRAPLGESTYWTQWVALGEESISLGWVTASKPFGDPSYASQYLFELAQEHWHQMLRGIAGMPVSTMTLPPHNLVLTLPLGPVHCRIGAGEQAVQ